jgi:hypothetical protein
MDSPRCECNVHPRSTELLQRNEMFWQRGFVWCMAGAMSYARDAFAPTVRAERVRGAGR